MIWDGWRIDNGRWSSDRLVYCDCFAMRRLRHRVVKVTPTRPVPTSSKVLGSGTGSEPSSGLLDAGSICEIASSPGCCRSSLIDKYDEAESPNTGVREFVADWLEQGARMIRRAGIAESRTCDLKCHSSSFPTYGSASPARPVDSFQGSSDIVSGNPVYTFLTDVFATFAVHLISSYRICSAASGC